MIEEIEVTDDVDGVLQDAIKIAIMYLNESPLFDGLTFCPIAGEANLRFRAGSDDSIFCLYYYNDEIAGMYSVGLGMAFTKEVIATEEIFYVAPAYRKTRLPVIMSDAMKHKCLDRGAQKIYTSSTAGFGARGYEKLMIRAGFKPFDGVFLYYG